MIALGARGSEAHSRIRGRPVTKARRSDQNSRTPIPVPRNFTVMLDEEFLGARRTRSIALVRGRVVARLRAIGTAAVNVLIEWLVAGPETQIFCQGPSSIRACE